MDSTKHVRGGPGFLMLLGLLFVGLKLGHVIAWSWWLVLLPLYGGLVIGLGLLVVAVVLVAVLAVFEPRRPARPGYTSVTI